MLQDACFVLHRGCFGSFRNQMRPADSRQFWSFLFFILDAPIFIFDSCGETCFGKKQRVSLNKFSFPSRIPVDFARLMRRS